MGGRAEWGPARPSGGPPGAHHPGRRRDAPGGISGQRPVEDRPDAEIPSHDAEAKLDLEHLDQTPLVLGVDPRDDLDVLLET
jgi:hypothetical protein